jgi:aminoglycoside phosphotransferase family enzyme/predicted kinase
MRSTLQTQDAVLAALSTPVIHGGAKVHKIETHASVVFLAADRAIKIKRAVRFPFLDYSTLERRKAACEAEVAVNRAFAPQIYLGVVPITLNEDGTIRIGGNGNVVEWAINMRRFDENETLDRVAERGELDESLSLKLVDTVLVAHRTAPPVNTEAWLAALRSFIDQNHDAFSASADLFPAADTEMLTSSSIAAYDRVYDLLRARGASGFIRRLHGDLHLGNIVLLDGMPVLFDAIEFDPLIAAGDVLYDLAFLLMDLRERGLASAANVVFNRYLLKSGESRHLDALAALPLFLSMRAAIRAKVTAAKLDANGAANSALIRESAQRYFAFALGALKPVSPLLVAVGGLSGTGKSVLARAIAPHLDPAPGAVILRSDVERKMLFGVAEIDRLPDAAYAPDIGKRVYAALAEKAEKVLAAGHSAVVDAVFARATERSQIAGVCRRRQSYFCGLFLTADVETRLSRVGGRRGDASDADQNVVLLQSEYDLSSMDWIRIDASGTLAQTLDAAMAALNTAPRRTDSPCGS